MSNALRETFHKTASMEPSEGLERRILMSIAVEEARRLRRKLFLSYAGLMGSLGVLAYAGVTSGKTFLQSDFWNLLSLLFSDAAAVLGFWQDFLLSLAETFPVISLIILLIPVFMLVLSLHFYASVAGKSRYHFA